MRLINFNPRSPYGERHVDAKIGSGSAGFQSTLPLRGATAGIIHHVNRVTISIHAPLTGSDGAFSLML